jgi:hypothetical protein
MISFACVGTIQQPGTQLDLDLPYVRAHTRLDITADTYRQTRAKPDPNARCIDRALCVMRAEQGLLMVSLFRYVRSKESNELQRNVRCQPFFYFSEKD